MIERHMAIGPPGAQDRERARESERKREKERERERPTLSDVLLPAASSRQHAHHDV